MPCIQINKHYRITADTHCWIVQKYAGINKNTGKQVWKPEGYYSGLPEAGVGLFSKLLRESQATTFDELRNDAREIRSLLEKLVSGAGK